MKLKHLTWITLVCLISFTISSPTMAAPLSGPIPTFSVVNIVPNTSVTIYTYNFPANKNFSVLMGRIGTRGVNGIYVTSINSGAGGSFSATFNIPSALHGLSQIAIRLQANDSSGYFAYNWFYNQPGGRITPRGSRRIIPTFYISGVVRDTSVTITTSNFPRNDSFDVLMGYIGTRGIGGIYVTTVSSGSGGTLTFTLNIPPALHGLYQIAIRLQSNTGSGYYAYNWFYNNTTGSSGGPGGIPGYTGYPTFSIVSVVRDGSVTIRTHNLPPSDTFNVLMGPMGTRGVNGYLVTTINTGSGGAQTLTFNIPAPLFGSYRISIRLQSITGSGYYAYNWFYNRTTP